MMMGVDEELNLLSEIENDALLADELDEKLETPSPLGYVTNRSVLRTTFI